MSAKEAELGSTNSALEASGATLNVKDREYVELSSAHGFGPGCRRSTEEAHTKFCRARVLQVHLVGNHASTQLPGILYALLVDKLLGGTYLGEYRVSVGKGGHSPYLGGVDSDEERVGRTPPPIGNGYVVAVSPPPHTS